jgi:hypothetical protein
MTNRLTSRLILILLVAWALLGAACAQERDPINRVQANALDKTFFVGSNIADPADDPEFYWRTYVIDASVSQTQLGPGTWGHVDRIRWEITEDKLIGHKAYQVGEGADCKGLQQDAPEDMRARCGYNKAPNGTIVASYRIISHFDIRRDYNSSTGEENNVISENTTDRPWPQRAFMRVDWSKNEVNNPMWGDMFTGKLWGEFDVTPVSHVNTDPAADDAPHFETDKGYFDVTNIYSIGPRAGDRAIPTCLRVGVATGSATYECDAQEATVRHSYLKIDPTNDFEPLENTKFARDVVGNPGGLGNSYNSIATSGRQGWDPQYGYTDQLYHQFAHIHNNWKKSHQDVACNVNTDADVNGTADQCENAVTKYTGNNGSQCDIYVKKCTIPVRDRELKTIGYWVNKETPDDLLDTVGPDGKVTEVGPLEDVIESWNQLMSVAIATRREVECRRTGDGSRELCHSEFFSSTADPSTKQMLTFGSWLIEVPKEKTKALTLCHNPVREYDQREPCGDTGYKARLGDIRRNFIFYTAFNSRAPYGGIANWNADPLTGEIVGAAAQIMAKTANSVASSTRDVLQLAMGDFTIDDIMGGGPQSAFSKQMLTSTTPPSVLSQTEMDKRIQALDLDSLNQQSGATAVARSLQTDAEQIQHDSTAPLDETANISMVDSAQLEFDGLAAKLKGTKIEAQLIDPNWMASVGAIDPNTQLDEQTLEFISPLRGMDPGRVQKLVDSMSSALANHGACYLGSEAPVAGSVVTPGLAPYYKAKFGGLDLRARGDAIFSEVQKLAVKGIALHEVGHSLGMLHEFASSWDSPNYTPQYWQLRTNEGKAAVSCKKSPRGGAQDTCMGPRYIDPETSDEQGMANESRPGILYFANTSTMEYNYEYFIATLGNGTYDAHAMKALYGRVLETFDDSVIPQREQQAFRRKLSSQLDDSEWYFNDNYVATPVHYTELARLMKVFDPQRDCRPATDAEKQKGQWRVVHGMACSPPPKDHWAWQDFISDAWYAKQPDRYAAYWHVKTREGKHLVRWPYRWGGSGGSYVQVNPTDGGADFYEVTVNTAKKFDQMYPWSYFRRQNREWTGGGVAAGTAEQYYSRLRGYHWQVAKRLIGVASTSKRLQDDNDLKPIAMAQTEIYNFLVKSILMPEPGDYYSGTKLSDPTHSPADQLTQVFDLGLSSIDPQKDPPAFTVGLGEGRYLATAFDNNIGGSWDYGRFVHRAGFAAEKAMAMTALVDGRPALSSVSRENTLDGRVDRLNFRTDMPDAIDRLVGGLLSEDWETVSLANPGNGQPLTPIDLSVRAATPARTKGSQVLFPNIGFKTQLSTATFTVLFSAFNSDALFVKKMGLWVEGDDGAPILDPSEKKISFIDPRTGQTYSARLYGSEPIDLGNGQAPKQVERGIGSRMIQHASALRLGAYRIDPATGKAQLDPTNGKPLVKDAKIEGEYIQYMGLLDTLRQVLATFKLVGVQ